MQIIPFKGPKHSPCNLYYLEHGSDIAAVGIILKVLTYKRWLGEVSNPKQLKSLHGFKGIRQWLINDDTQDFNW